MVANLDYLANHRQPAKIIPTVKLLINGEFIDSHSAPNGAISSIRRRKRY